jgi:flagellar secretion chaperone FliS
MLKDRSKEPAMGAAVAYSSYRRAELETISPRELLVRLFLGLERFVEEAAMGMQNRQYETAANACRRFRDIVLELQATLNFDSGGDVAVRLDQIYKFLITECSEANLRKDAAKMRALLRVVRPLREGWQAVPDAHAHTTSLTGDDRRNVISIRG